jgi:hypothetical protein
MGVHVLHENLGTAELEARLLTAQLELVEQKKRTEGMKQELLELQKSNEALRGAVLLNQETVSLAEKRAKELEAETDFDTARIFATQKRAEILDYDMKVRAEEDKAGLPAIRIAETKARAEMAIARALRESDKEKKPANATPPRQQLRRPPPRGKMEPRKPFNPPKTSIPPAVEPKPE